MQAPRNILLYARKANDIEQIMDVLRDCVMYLAQNLGKAAKRKGQLGVPPQRIYMERWALDAL